MRTTKRVRKIAAVIAALLVLTLPMSAFAADGDLLLKVDYTSEEFETINVTDDTEVEFADRFDVVIKKNYIKFEQKADDPASGCHLWYMYETDLKITDDSHYTYYFEAATPVAGKYDGIAIATNGTDHYMLYGSFSNNGDNGASDFRMRVNNKDKFVTGWADKSAVTTYVEEDSEGYLFTSVKIELDGRRGKVFWLDENEEWVELSSSFTLPEGCVLAAGVYGRDGNRPLIVKNARIIGGVDMSYDDMPTTGDAKAETAAGLLVVGVMAAAAYAVLEKKYRFKV